MERAGAEVRSQRSDAKENASIGHDKGTVANAQPQRVPSISSPTRLIHAEFKCGLESFDLWGLWKFAWCLDIWRLERFPSRRPADLKCGLERLDVWRFVWRLDLWRLERFP